MKNKINFLGTDVEGQILPYGGGIFVPDTQISDLTPMWRSVVAFVAELTPDTPYIVSSIIRGLKGAYRPEKSHRSGAALDLAPVHSLDRVFEDNAAPKNPRLADNRPLLTFLARNWKLPIALFLEGDHFHIDTGFPPGVYAYSTYRAVYTIDGKNISSLSSLPTHRTIFVAKRDGSILPAPSMARINKVIPPSVELSKIKVNPKLAKITPKNVQLKAVSVERKLGK